MSSLEQQQQKRPSLHFIADVGAGIGAGAAVAADTAMSGSGLGTGCSPATTPLGNGAGFLPDMPQWKKDLIQRRKTNVARTNAAASSPTSMATALAADTSCMALTEPAGKLLSIMQLDFRQYFYYLYHSLSLHFKFLIEI